MVAHHCHVRWCFEVTVEGMACFLEGNHVRGMCLIVVKLKGYENAEDTWSHVYV
jgi:hypothetical protein